MRAFVLLGLLQGGTPPPSQVLLPPASGLAAPAAAEIVAAVRIEAAPADIPRLARYVEVATGEPLSPAAVRHAVELLYATGEFEDVVVESRSRPEGLEVVFRPLPAPRLTTIRVEGDPVLSPRAVRKIARLKDGEPLWPARLERAARDAAVALTQKGYLEARVSAEARRVGEGAQAVFRVHSGRQARVVSVSLEGAGALEGLLRSAAPRPGEIFRRAKVEKAAEKMRKRLVEAGRWRAAVSVRESYDPSAARMSLAFEVQPGPALGVEFRGERPAVKLRHSTSDLLEEGGVKADALEEAIERVERDYRQRGHREVAVSMREEPRPGGVVIVYEVRPGPRASVASVSLTGEPAAGLQELLNTRAGAPLQDRVLDQDVRALTRALEDQGHVEAKVEAEADEGGGEIPVVFRLRPGPRTTVAAVEIEPPSPPLEEASPRELRLQPGRPYRVRDLAVDRNNLMAAYRNAGYLQAEATPEVLFSEDRSEARITLRVSPGPRTEVDHIVIAGLDETRETVVRRELLLKEGDPFGLQKVLDSQRRLGALGIFQRVNITEMDPESVEKRSLVVTAEEAPRTTIAYGIGYAERDRFRGSVEVSRRNLFGLDRSLSAFGRYSLRGNRFLTTFREPYLLGTRQELFLTGFREEEDRDSFDFVRFGGLLQVARALSSRWSLILRYTLRDTKVFAIEVPLDELDRQFRTSTFSGPSASVVNDTRDDALDPRLGHFLGADVELSHAALGGDSFLKGFLQASTYQRLSERFLLALSGRVGLARTFGMAPPRLPLPDRFFAGGDYGLRGFKVDTAGPLEPSTTGRLLPTGGNTLLLGGAELRMDAGRFVSLAAFSEAGNVYPLVSNLDPGNLRYTAGLGLRYKSAFGPLRIDWGYKLNRRPGESPSRLHLTIGHAF